MARRSFSTDFKREAASLVVGLTAMRRCVEQLQQERVGKTPKSKSMTPEQQRI